MKLKLEFSTFLCSTFLLAGGLTVGVGSAMALSVPWTLGEPNTFQDQSAEYLIDVNQNGVLDVGDKLRGVFDVDQIQSPNAYEFGDPPNNSYLLGYFEVEVLARSIDPVGSSTQTWIQPTSPWGIAQGANYTSDLYSYVFGPSADFTALYGTDALMAIFIDDVNTLVYSGVPGLTTQDAIDAATLGDLYWTFGLGDTGEWVIGAAPEDVEIFKYIEADTGLFSTKVGLNMLSNPIGPDLLQERVFAKADGSIVNVDLTANITLFGVGDLADTPFDLKNKVDGTLVPSAIPEPATMTLFGIGLAGLGLIGRRRARK